MKINIKNLVSISDANQNFSKVARLVDKDGSIVILKNNRPRYVVIKYDEFVDSDTSDVETVENAANKIMNRHIKAFEELAK